MLSCTSNTFLMIIKKVFYVQDSIEKKTHHIGIYKGEICLSSGTSSLSPGGLVLMATRPCSMP
jgi:hypothetical protein